MAEETWRPLLEGEAAERAWKVIFEIADALVEHGGEKAWNPALTEGMGGIAVFFSYLALAREDEEIADHAVQFYEKMVEATPGFPFLPGLYSGIAGVGWTVEHLAGRLFTPEEGEDEDDSNQALDETLLESLGKPWTGDYDLVLGLVGRGLYALERLPRPSALECLDGILSQLEALAEKGPEGTTWMTPPELLPEHQREQFPGGYHNLGVAHGVPGVIAFLGRVSEIPSLRDRARSLLAGAVSWVLAQELPPESPSRFATFAEDATPCRLAWCYGDAGIAAALFGAARRTGNLDWEREALRIALASAERPPETAGVADAGLCHGTAGLLHVFNRLYQATGREELARAARLWWDQTFEQRRPDGLGGFLAYTPHYGEGKEWNRNPSFLTGSAGVGLALLAAVSSLPPEWDRLLLVDLP